MAYFLCLIEKCIGLTTESNTEAVAEFVITAGLFKKKKKKKNRLCDVHREFTMNLPPRYSV